MFRYFQVSTVILLIFFFSLLAFHFFHLLAFFAVISMNLCTFTVGVAVIAGVGCSYRYLHTSCMYFNC